jgi:phospholipid/cholesterol/gamma-HCH transport system substrate-binding protein
MINRNVTEILIGAVVLVTAAWFLLYAGNKTGDSTGGESYELVANFRSVEGISIGTDVKLAGVKVGSIHSLGLDAETYRVNAVFSIDKALKIPEDSQALITSEGLLGGNFLELVPGGSFDYLEPGNTILDTQGSVSLITLLMRLGTGSVPD